MNKQDFENCKAELKITIGNKITEARDNSEFKEWGSIVTEPCR